MHPAPTLLNNSHDVTLMAAWAATLNIEDPTERSTDGRKCCPTDFVNFINSLRQATFAYDCGPGTVYKDRNYRIDVQRKGQIYSTLAIQTNGQGSKMVCNLYIPIEDVKIGYIGLTAVKEAFRHMFKVRKYKRGGHMVIYTVEDSQTPLKNESI